MRFSPIDAVAGVVDLLADDEAAQASFTAATGRPWPASGDGPGLEAVLGWLGVTRARRARRAYHCSLAEEALLSLPRKPPGITLAEVRKAVRDVSASNLCESLRILVEEGRAVREGTRCHYSYWRVR